MSMKSKLLKNIIVATIVATSTITLNPLQNKGIQVVEAKSKIKLNTTKKTIYKGSTYTLKVKGTKKKIKWSTSNKKVATVNSKGKVTAKKKGTATITAKVGGKKLKCKITVKNPIKKIRPRKGVYTYNLSAKDSDGHYSVIIKKVTKTNMVFYVEYMGRYSSPVYVSNDIKVGFSGNKTKTFKWADSWENKGTGTIKFLSSKKISITMKETYKSEWNRGSLESKNMILHFKTSKIY